MSISSVPVSFGHAGSWETLHCSLHFCSGVFLQRELQLLLEGHSRADPGCVPDGLCWSVSASLFSCAADRVYSEVKRNARAALLRQIERERDGDMIDRSLLKNILDIFIEVGSQGLRGQHRATPVLLPLLFTAVLGPVGSCA